MKCPKCNAEVSERAAFCPQCGAKLDGTIIPAEHNGASNHGNGFRLSKKLLTVAVAVIVVIVLALSCPNKQTHAEALNNAIMTALAEKMSEDSTMNDGSGLIAQGLASSVVPKVLNSKLNVDNYFLFSVGKLSDEGKSKMVSFGILGHVFPIGLSDSEKALDEAINGKHKD